MSSSNFNVLFLCTGNSARSIIAEGILRKLGGETFFSYSAGSQPAGKPNPYALAVLRSHGIDVSFARSKRWDEFADSDAPKMDLIITVCDNAAGETCPVWPGHPSMAPWGVPDPATVQGSHQDTLAAFERTYLEMEVRIKMLLEAKPTAKTIGDLARSISPVVIR